jgi:sarcosine oxidase delta subunit
MLLVSVKLLYKVPPRVKKKTSSFSLEASKLRFIIFLRKNKKGEITQNLWYHCEICLNI